MEKSLILFDFDGTVMDTSPGIFESANYTYAQLGYPPMKKEVERLFVGPPLPMCFRLTSDIKEELVGKACEIYRGYYFTTGRFKAVFYPGMLETLAYLKEKGYHTGIASYKRSDLCHEMAKYFKIEHLFDVIVGIDEKNTKSKADIIREAIKTAGNFDKKDILMIGDTKLDEAGAKEVGVDFAAVTYGFGFSPESPSEGALLNLAKIEDLKNYL